MSLSLIISLTVILTAWFATASSNSGICYSSNRIQDGDQLPCDPRAEVSSCCQLGYICLSNGLCEPSGSLSQYYTTYYTGTCTDPSWNSPSTCPEICNNNKTNPSNGNGVVTCGDDNYCCFGLQDSECCSTQSLLFTLGSSPATIETTLGSMTTSTTPTTNAPVSATSSVPPSSRPSSSPSAISSSSSKTSSPSAATSITPPPSPSPSSNHVAVGAGVGAGVPVGLAILAGLVYLIRRRSRMGNDRDGIATYLDNKNELDGGNRKALRGASELAVGSRTPELSGHSLAELQHPTSL